MTTNPIFQEEAAPVHIAHMALRHRTTNPEAAPLATTPPPSVDSSQSFAFPVETLDDVFGYLWDDFATLCKLSLTCRSWSSITRPHIFRRAWVDGRERLLELGRMVEDTPAIAFWIREFQIRRIYDVVVFLEIWTSHDLYAVMEKLQRVRSLTFRHCCLDLFAGYEIWFANFDWTTLVHNVGKMSSVKELVFVGCILELIVALPFQRYLPNLQSLRFELVQFYSFPEDSTLLDNIHKRSAHITSLHFEPFPPMYASQRFMLENSDLKLVKTMDIVTDQTIAIEHGYNKVTAFILEHSWPSLHTLRFNIAPPQYKEILRKRHFPLEAPVDSFLVIKKKL